MDLLNLLESSDDEGYIPMRKIYRPRINFDMSNNFEFREKFRMRREEAEYVLSQIGPYLLNSNWNKLYQLCPKDQLLLALHWMGNGSAYHGLADMHGIRKSSVCRILNWVINAIVNKMFQQVVKFPKNIEKVAAEFLTIGGFPCVAGCVDGTLINIISPTQNELQYVDRYGNHSLNVMMVYGPDYSFFDVNARWPESVHDARVLRTSEIHRRFEAEWRPFPGAILLGNETIYINPVISFGVINYTPYRRSRFMRQIFLLPRDRTLFLNHSDDFLMKFTVKDVAKF